MSHAHSLATPVGPTQGCWDNESHYVPVNLSLIFVYSMTLMNWEKEEEKKEEKKLLSPPQNKSEGKKKDKVLSALVKLSKHCQ